jgi:hypothetical protein
MVLVLARLRRMVQLVQTMMETALIIFGIASVATILFLLLTDPDDNPDGCPM